MTGLINKTDTGFFIISPMRKLSPIRFSTKNESNAMSCKRKERLILILFIPVLLAIYRKYDGIESVTLIAIAFLIAQSSVYILIWFFTPNLSKYDKNIHGDILS